MLLHRYERSLRHPFTRHPAAGRNGAGLCQHPLPLASALDLESGETVTWKVLDRTHLLLVRLPERKQLKGEAEPQPAVRKRARRTRGQRP